MAIGKISFNSSSKNLKMKISGSGTIHVDFGGIETKAYVLNDAETAVDFTFSDESNREIVIENAGLIYKIDVSNNNINNIHFEKCTRLNTFVGYDNKIEMLDFTNCNELQRVHIQNNPICVNKVNMQQMIFSLPDRNKKSFGSILMYDFVPPRNEESMSEGQKSIRNLRRELENISIAKDWYFGSAIIYDEIENKKMPNYVLWSNAYEIWESAEYGKGLVYADVYNMYIRDTISEWDSDIFLRKYEVKADGTVIENTLIDETATFDNGHGTGVASTLLSNGTNGYGLIPKAKLVGVFRANNGFAHSLIASKNVPDKLNELEKLDFIVQTSTLANKEGYNYPEYEQSVKRLLENKKAIWFCCSSNNGDDDDSTKDEIAYAPEALLVSGSLSDIDTQSFNSYTGPSFSSDRIKLTAPYIAQETYGTKENGYINTKIGTSYTCPIVAGIFGLLKILYVKKHGSFELNDMKKYLYNHCKPLIYNVKWNAGYGIPNCMYYHNVTNDIEISTISKKFDLIDLRFTNSLRDALRIEPYNVSNKNVHLAKKYNEDIIVDSNSFIHPLKNDGSVISRRFYADDNSSKFIDLDIKLPNNRKGTEIKSDLLFSLDANNGFKNDATGEALEKSGTVTVVNGALKFDTNGYLKASLDIEKSITMQMTVKNMSAAEEEYPIYLYNSQGEENIIAVAKKQQGLLVKMQGTDNRVASNHGEYIAPESNPDLTVITLVLDFEKSEIINYNNGIPTKAIGLGNIQMAGRTLTNSENMNTLKKIDTIMIGNRPALGNGCKNMEIYNVRIFNRALSTEEVIQNTSALILNTTFDPEKPAEGGINMDYKGSVTLISGLRQANNGKFALVDGSAVQYKTETNPDGSFKSVVQKIEELNSSSTNEAISEDEIASLFN